MRFICAITLLLAACTPEVNEPPVAAVGPEKEPNFDSLFHMEKDTLAETQIHVDYSDSAGWRIIDGRYPSGKLAYRHLENPLTGLVTALSYSEAGALRDSGTLTLGSHVPIGIWKYCMPGRKNDSLVNMDKKYRIPYFQALKLAAANGVGKENREVSLVKSEGDAWQVISCKNPATHGRKCEGVTINCTTGKVTKVFVISVTDAIP